MNTTERRDFNCEIRADDKNPNVLRGYAAMFGKRSLDLGGFVEEIRKGAFARSIKESSDILALDQHDSSKPLARRSVGTLAISEDEAGLAVEITLPDTSYARDLRENVAKGNIKGMSFGFSTRKDAWTRGEPGKPQLRELIDVELHEVSTVTFPAYPDTSIALRSKPQDIEKPANKIEDLKRIESLRLRLITLPTH